jgi:hypothetical protein
MLRIPCLTVFFVIIATSHVLAQQPKPDLVMNSTKEYIDSIEWDPNFLVKAKEYATYKKIYMEKLSSESSQDLFVSSVMLGLLKEEQSLPQLKKVKSNDPLVKIGVSFALCMLNYDYRANRRHLMELGKITQNAGGAASLKYLEAVNLLSLLKDDGFIEYASNLQQVTEEAYQREIIDFAIKRYKMMREKE